MSSTSVKNNKGITMIELLTVLVLSGIITSLLTMMTIFVGTSITKIRIKTSSNISVSTFSKTIISQLNDFGPQDCYIPLYSPLDTTRSIYFSRLTYVAKDPNTGLGTRYKTRNYNGLQAYNLVDTEADLLKIYYDLTADTVSIYKYNYDLGVDSTNETNWTTFISNCEKNPIGNPITVIMSTIDLSPDIDDIQFQLVLDTVLEPLNVSGFSNQEGGTKIVKLVTKFSDDRTAETGEYKTSYVSISFKVPRSTDSGYFQQLIHS